MSNGIVVTFNIWYILIPVLGLVVFFSRKKIIKICRRNICLIEDGFECKCGECHPELYEVGQRIPYLDKKIFKCHFCSDQGIVKTKLDVLKNGRLVKQTVEIPCSCRKRSEWDRLLKKASQ